MSIATILDRYPTPPCAELLGLDILEADRDAGRVRIAFEGRREFCNAGGSIQGGFLTAMLDDCIGPAVLICTDAQAYPTTVNLNVSFLAPVRPGHLIGEARIVQLGKTIGFVEAELRDEAGTIIGRATASVRIIPFGKAVP